MDNFFVRSWPALALRGAAGIAFGLMALLWPGLTLLTFVLLFAAYALAGGVVSVAGAVRHRRTEDDWWVALLLGIVSIGAGIVAVISPAVTALVLVFVMGANALVVGVLDIVAAIRLRRAVVGEWLLALAGVASVAFGALVFAYPAAGALAFVWMASVYALVTGAFLLAAALRMRRLALRHEGTHDAERRVLPDRRVSLAR